ncbi:hypothetical protein [Pseudomonas sp. 14A]|uniref:hypothetical protein n=1 Tax=Pseudomonas sp. 14A TaxID=2823142 RepID=UPI001B837D6E|nr:hypothetical protein [Pseudomonas sp. 14A]MBR7196852.1 hypothetical protein [Pseudomonas sp. 14A]
MLRLPSGTLDQDQNEPTTAFEQAMLNAAQFDQVRQDFLKALLVNHERLARLKHLMAKLDEPTRNRHLPGWPTSFPEVDAPQLRDNHRSPK